MEFFHCINYLLTVSQHEVFQTFATQLNSFGITPGQYGVLSCLWTHGPSTPKEIAQKLRLENSTVSGVLDRMQKRGLIDRIVDPNDRRSVQVVATETGMEMKDEVLRTVDELNAQILGGFTQDQKDNLIDCLYVIGKVEMQDQTSR